MKDLHNLTKIDATMDLYYAIKILIQKDLKVTNKNIHYERFKNYKGSNLTKEFSWDKSVGKEVWN